MGNPCFVPATSPSRAELYVLTERVALRVMTWLRKRGHAKDDDHASNDTPDRTFAEVLAQLATQRGKLENVKDDSGESEGPAESAGPLRDEAVTRHGFNLHASLTIGADDDLGRERLCRYGLRPPFSLSRFRVLRDGRISYRVKKSSRRVSRCRIMTPVECIARLCALVPPPRYPLTRFDGVLAPRAKLRPRIVPKLPGSAPRACSSASSRLPDQREPRGQAGERPPPRDKTGPIIPAALPVSATTSHAASTVRTSPMPNVLPTARSRYQRRAALLRCERGVWPTSARGPSRERGFVDEARVGRRRSASRGRDGVEDPPGDAVVGDDRADLEPSAAEGAGLDVDFEGTREQGSARAEFARVHLHTCASTASTSKARKARKRWTNVTAPA